MIENRPARAAPLPSERKFGLTIGTCAVLYAVFFARSDARPWLVGVGILCLAVALLRPKLLSAPNKLWFMLGLALQRIVSPIVLAALFFLVVSPFAWLWRAFGRDEVKSSFDRGAKTYWLQRAPSEPSADSLRWPF